MASITYWSRLEPRPRNALSIARALSATVRDPLWMLTRQWQFGEFAGEDGASPSWVELSASTTAFTGWSAEGDAAGVVRPIDPGRALEDQVEAEPVTPDLWLAVELGVAMADVLDDLGHGDLLASFLDAFALPVRGDDLLAALPDQAEAGLARAAGGRIMDGVAVHGGALASRPGGLPPELVVPAGREGDAGEALDALLAFVRAVYGEVGLVDADAWRPDRLEYVASVEADVPDGRAVLAAYAGRNGEFDWYSFDLRSTSATETAPAVTEAGAAVLPVNVRFRGMPNPRWWLFEHAGTNFGRVKPDRRNVAMLIGLDFMLVHGNDWYVAPLEQPVGTLSRIDRLVVHDVFGGQTFIDPADADGAAGRSRWTMFSTSVEGAPDESAGWLVVPPSVPMATAEGPAIEDVRFVRDEMANIVWAIEHVTENALGRPWLGHERSIATFGPPPPPPAPPEDAALRYVIQTVVPPHWIPFLPVQVDAVTGDIALERAAMTRPGAGGAPIPIEPVGRVLHPSSLGGLAYRVREEEVTREGVRVTRRFVRSRWTDGNTRLWISRRALVGRGEGSSGLRFDVADPVVP